MIGFLGVLFVIQPGFESFNIYYLIVLIGVLLITITTFIVNKYNHVTTNIGYFLYGGFFVHFFSILLFLMNPLKVTLFEFFLISTAALFINSAMFFATTAFKIAQKHYASVFSLVYLQVLWSSLVGIFIFNEYMNLYAYIGALFIVLSGIFSLPSQIKQLTEKYTKIVEKNDGKVIQTQNWGLINLSYIIKKNKKGNYIHFKIEGPAKIVNDLEKNESMDKNLLRYLTVKVKKFDLETNYFDKIEEKNKKI